jgi:DNA-binding NtrC family response regulator
MNQKTRMFSAGQELKAVAVASEFAERFTRVPEPPPARNSAWAGPEAIPALEKIKVSLVFAYLNSNLNLASIPLKSFMDEFEKKILLACLRLTKGNQKNAAALLSLKPTALFEKMRKHGIRSQRGRLPGRPAVPLAGDGDN